MQYKFLEEIPVDKKALMKNEQSGINPFLLENNAKQAEKIIEFLNKPTPLLLVNGYLGTGKTRVVEHCLTFLSKNTVLLNYNCFETTSLDDILLAFFDEFRKLIAQQKISLPKGKVDNFTQKINAYLQSIENPLVIVLNSFDEITGADKQEILGFISHLSSSFKIKFILIGRVFKSNDFEKIKHEKVSILAFEKSIFEKYLRFEDFKQIGPFSDELYKHTRGYYFYTTLVIKIMRQRNLNLIDFLGGYGKSFLTFNDFILREALSFVDPISGHLFRFLTIMRHPVSKGLLQKLHLYDENRINFFIENLILSKDGNNIYLQDYFKAIAENSIPQNVSLKLHQGCIDLYNTQLPLKPLERDLLISRQTMRKEIEYHSVFIPKKLIINKPSSAPQIEYREYEGAANTPAPIKPQEPVTLQEKDDKLEKMSFIFDTDEHNVLGTIADSIKNFIDYSDLTSKQLKEEEKLSLIELINLARQEEQNYNYKRAVTVYHRALTLTSDDDYYTFLPTIYTKIASAYRSLSDWYNAIKYYEDAIGFYDSSGDTLKSNEIKLEIANIFYITFKQDKAKELLNEILSSDILTNELFVKTKLALGNICGQNYNDYKEAIETADTDTDKQTLAELYFKFALSCEEQDEIEIAVKYYKKCIELDLDPKNNPHLTSSMSNLGFIYDELGDYANAVKYYEQSLKNDELIGNYNGIYLTSMKLAEISTKKAPEKTVKFYEKAMECAKKLNDPFYISACAAACGDYYYDRKENEDALKNYIFAYEYAKNNLSNDNLEKIRLRFNDIKARLGEEKFKELAEELINAK